MKEFKDLKFGQLSRSWRPYPAGADGIRAEEHFDNGYGVSVISGDLFYCNGPDEFELAVINSNGSLNYDTPITNDVLGHLSEEEVTQIMKRVQQL